MFPEFPDDNKNEDFLNEFRQKIAEQSNTSFEERKNELNRSKSVFIGAVSGVVLAGIVGWFVLSPRYAQETDAELPVIRRPQTAIKVQPTEPGGMEILNQDKSVYGILDKSEDNAKSVENLLPPPEEPKLPVITPEEETASIDTIITAAVEENANNNIETAQVVEEAEKIMNWGFREFDNYKMLKQGQKIVELPVWFGTEKSVDLLVNQDVLRTIKKSKAQKSKMTAVYDKPVKAPIKQGDKLGTVRIEIPGSESIEVPLIANKDIKKVGWFGRILENIKYILFGAE